MKDLFSALIAGIQNSEAKDEFFASIVFSAWKRAAGPELANKTEPIDMEGSELVIAVKDITWKRSLESLAPQLLYKVNRELREAGAVKRLKFRVAPETVTASSKEKVEARPDANLEEVAPELAEAAASIRDDGMRKAFSGAAANCLSRRDSDR